MKELPKRLFNRDESNASSSTSNNHQIQLMLVGLGKPFFAKAYAKKVGIDYENDPNIDIVLDEQRNSHKLLGLEDPSTFSILWRSQFSKLKEANNAGFKASMSSDAGSKTQLGGVVFMNHENQEVEYLYQSNGVDDYPSVDEMIQASQHKDFEE